MAYNPYGQGSIASRESSLSRPSLPLYDLVEGLFEHMEYSGVKW